MQPFPLRSKCPTTFTFLIFVYLTDPLMYSLVWSLSYVFLSFQSFILRSSFLSHPSYFLTPVVLLMYSSTRHCQSIQFIRSSFHFTAYFLLTLYTTHFSPAVSPCGYGSGKPTASCLDFHLASICFGYCCPLFDLSDLASLGLLIYYWSIRGLFECIDFHLNFLNSLHLATEGINIRWLCQPISFRCRSQVRVTWWLAPGM